MPHHRVDDQEFQNLVEVLPAGIFIQTQGLFAHLNQEARRILGVGAIDTILGTPVIESFVERERPMVLDRIQRLNRDRKPVDRVRETILRTDGTEVPVEISAIPYRFQEQDGALVFVRDLTPELEAQTRISVKDELLRLTGAMAKVGGWEFDTQTGKGTWTDEVARIHDLEPEQPTNVSLGLSFYTSESRNKIEGAIQAAVNEAKPYDLVLELVTNKGNHKWVRSQGTPHLKDGKVDRIRGIFQDITEQRNSDLALKEETERLNITLRSIGDGVITTDTQGLVVLMSRSAEEMTGWTLEEAVGRPLSRVLVLVHEWTKEPLESPVAQVLRDGITAELANHTVLVDKTGRERIIGDSAAPIRDKTGAVTGVVLVFRDMTEKQKLADAIQRAQSLESIGLLAAGIAHDFNNLLSGLFGQIQLASSKLQQGRPLDAAANLDRANEVFDRARNLTGQLMAFSKGGAPVRTTFDLGATVRKTAQFALSGSNVEAHFEIAPDLWPCIGDPNQLAQAVENLIINARQSMEAGGTVSITAQNKSEGEKKFLVLSVKDQGPGLAPGLCDKIFDPFFSTKPGGHGLGLAAVQTIVLKHEGRIEVRPNPGQGAEFQILLPVQGVKG